MHAATERDVTVGAPRYVQAVRVFELLRIAVGGTNHNVKNLPLADVLAARPEVLPGCADSALRRSVETQELLGGKIDQFRSAFQLGELTGKLMKPPQRHGDSTARGATAGGCHHVAGRKYFEIGQTLAGDLGRG